MHAQKHKMQISDSNIYSKTLCIWFVFDIVTLFGYSVVRIQGLLSRHPPCHGSPCWSLSHSQLASLQLHLTLALPACPPLA